MEQIVSLLIKSINDNKMDDAIALTYDNLETIKNATKEYCFNIKDFKNNLIKIDSYVDPSLNIKNGSIPDYLDVFRNCIHRAASSTNVT